MAQPVNQPALGDDLHPGADTGGAGADPHETEVAIGKRLEGPAKGAGPRGLNLGSHPSVQYQSRLPRARSGFAVRPQGMLFFTT